MPLHVVLGASPVGSKLTELLVDQGHQVRVLSRAGNTPPATADRPTLEHLAVERVALDVSDTDALSAAVDGADVLYQCAGPNDHQGIERWPLLAASLLTAAERSGAVLVTLSDLSLYGPTDRPFHEDSPLTAASARGRMRVQLWEQALARHATGAVRVVEARASTLVGPGLTDGHLASRVVPRLLAGKEVKVIGSPKAPHSWTALADVAATLAVLGSDARAYGRAWHVPTAPPVSQREAIVAMCRAAGRKPVRVGTVPQLALRVAANFSPLVRELAETRYRFARPFVLDSTAATAMFGLTATPLEQTWEQTVAWWQASTAATK